MTTRPILCAVQYLKKIVEYFYQRCAGAGVQESTPAGVGVFQKEPEQDQEWIFSIGTEAGAGVIFNHSVYKIILSVCTLCDL